ncbi:MAG: ankyrin repeat domain-containing protein, partial [Wolbachia sp.]
VNVDEADKNGWTPLHYAAKFDQLEVAKFLIEKGANINAADTSTIGEKPIHVAAENNSKNIIEFLISKGVSVNDTDKDGRTPLYWASWNGRLDVVEYLIGKGADISAKDKDGRNPLDVAKGYQYDNVVEYLQQAELRLNKQLLTAVQDGDFEKVKDLVSRGTSLDTKYNGGWTLMHYAAYEGKLDIVKYLVDKLVILEIKYNDGETLSCNASLDNHSDIVDNYLDTMKCLVGKESSLEIKDDSGKTPLHCAAFNGKLDVVKYFVDEEKIDASITDNSGWTPLHWASGNGHLDLVKYLIGKGANLVNIKDKDGKTPLDIADQRGYTDIAKILKQAQSGLYKKYNELLTAVLENNLNKVKDLIGQGTSLETKDSYGWTLLHFASIHNYSDMAEYLISKGVDVNAKDKYGKTSLHLTSWFNRLDVMKCLINNDANINAKDNNGKTPLDDVGFNSDARRILMQAHLDKELLTTVEGSYLGKIKGLIAEDVSGGKGSHGAYYYAWNGNLGMVKFLVERDVDVNATDKYGCTLLHWATLKGHLDVAKFLASKGANVNAEDILGRKPIHFAVINDHRNIIEFLLDKGIIVNSADKQGHTPLHWASWSGHLDMVKYLIDKGANINAKCKDSKTPLDIARDKGHSDVVKYLEKIKEERNKTIQRRRRHHHGDYNRHHNHLSSKLIDSSNQPGIAASSSTRPSSWINDLFSWVKSSVGGFRAVLPEETSSTTSSILQVDAPIDVNGTIILLDVLVRKVTGQKYIFTSDQNVSLLEAQGYALNITEKFEKVVEQAALKSGISMHRLNIDFVEIQKEVTGKIMSGKFNEISEVLSSYVEKACTGREAGYPGKLSSKKFDKFMLEFNSRLNVVLDQSIQQILHNVDGTLEVDGAKKRQMSLEPQSYLSNASIQSHSKDKVSTCLSEIGVTKLGGNLNR